MQLFVPDEVAFPGWDGSIERAASECLAGGSLQNMILLKSLGHDADVDIPNEVVPE
jgi:hypothetical protein